jgi:hypothetical protein
MKPHDQLGRIIVRKYIEECSVVVPNLAKKEEELARILDLE